MKKKLLIILGFALLGIVIIFLIVNISQPDSDNVEVIQDEVHDDDIDLGPPSTLEEREERAEIARDISGEPNLDLTFAHVAPGQYSEIYGVVKNAVPGDKVTAFLSKETTVENVTTGSTIAEKTIEVDSDGNAYFTWRITEYGTYKMRTTVKNSQGVQYLVAEEIVVE